VFNNLLYSVHHILILDEMTQAKTKPSKLGMGWFKENYRFRFLSGYPSILDTGSFLKKSQN